MARNINIQQDPLGQALDMFSQAFHSGITSAIEQRGIREREDVRKHEGITVSIMDNLINQMKVADVDTGYKILDQFYKVREDSPPRLNNLGQSVGSYLQDSIENKREASLKVSRMNETLEQLEKAVSKGDEIGFDNAKNIALSIEKNQLDELADIQDNVFTPAITQSLAKFGRLENIRKVKTGLRGFDTDLETPGIQYGEDMGDFTRTMLESVERTVAENPKKALDMLLTRVPTAEQQDVKAEKIIKKAIQTESRRIEKEEIKDLREEQKQIRTDWNTKVQNKIDAVQENLKNTGFKETEVAKFTAKITKTAKGDIANVEEMTKQTANTIYQLHNRMSDADIPATADDLFDAIEDVEKVGNRKMIKKAEADLVLAKSTGNEDLIDSAQDALEVAKNTTTKDLVDIEKQRLADWWLRNTNKVGTLDVDKFWEMPSGSRQKTRKDAMTNMISLYFTLKQGSPTVQESIAIESDLDLDEDINALLDISKSGE